MYRNVGKTLKTLTKAVVAVISIASVIAGILLTVEGGENDNGLLIFIGILLMLVGPFVAYLSSLVMYGFGEIVDRIISIEKEQKMNGVENATIINLLSSIEKRQREGSADTSVNPSQE